MVFYIRLIVTAQLLRVVFWGQLTLRMQQQEKKNLFRLEKSKLHRTEQNEKAYEVAAKSIGTDAFYGGWERFW